MDEFVIDEPALVRFEFLAYCTIGNDSYVTAWDLDEIKIYANCRDASSNMIDIAGEINDVFGEPLENVEVKLCSNNQDANQSSVFTDNEGRYAFTELQKDYDYKVVPELNQDFLKGVTTADLIHIQRHALGIDQFDSPYQLIAADADNSDNTTAIDILQLRKLILGVYEELPNNNSYRFGTTGQELPVENPWMIEESVIIDNADEMHDNISFNAIKVGDVSSFESSAKNDDSTRKSNNNASALKTENVNLRSGELTSVIFSIEDAQDIEGLQFSFDMSAFEYFELNGLGEYGQSYVFDESRDLLNVSWISEAASDMLEFELLVTASESGSLADMLKLDESKIEALTFLGKNLEEDKIELAFENVPLTANSVKLTPNPFQDMFNIEIESAGRNQVTIDIMDLSGRLLHRTNKTIGEGMHTETIYKSDIASYQGVMIVRVNNSGEINTFRVISL